MPIEPDAPRPRCGQPIAAVVVSYRPDLAAFSDALTVLAGEEPRLKVIGVANGCDPADPRSSLMQPRVTILARAENLGFAGGANLGVGRAFAGGASVVVILNDDVEADSASVVRLGDEATPVRAIGATTTADIDSDAFAGGAIDWRHGFGYHASGRLDYLTGAALAIHRATWERVGPFDASLFLYYEDVDWSLRARARGVELAVSPITVHHRGGASSGGTRGPTWAYYHTRNRIRFLRNYRGRFAALRAWCWTFAWTLGYLRDRRRVLIPAHLRALRDAAFGRHGRGPYPRRP